MAKSLRSKRMRRNRAIQAEKKAPRVLKRMKEAMEAGKKHNVSWCLYLIDFYVLRVENITRQTTGLIGLYSGSVCPLITCTQSYITNRVRFRGKCKRVRSIILTCLYQEMVAAEKAKMAAAQEMQSDEGRLPEPEVVADQAMVPEEKQFDVKTGLNKDGSCVSIISRKIRLDRLSD